MEMNTIFRNVRERHPLVHCITNNVTINDCAQVLLMAGAAPVMATAEEEMEAMQSLTNALCVNIGTLTQAVIPSMFLAAAAAKENGHASVLDPVGAGATPFRTETAQNLLTGRKFSLVRGNISEIKALAGLTSVTRGTDADATDLIEEEQLDTIIPFARRFAETSGTLVGISGPIDVIATAEKVCLVRNGHPIMTTISGTGCMLSTLCAAFLAANPDDYFEAAAAAFCVMGVCGEKAFYQLAAGEGPAAWRTKFLDALALLTPEELQAKARYEIR